MGQLRGPDAFRAIRGAEQGKGPLAGHLGQALDSRGFRVFGPRGRLEVKQDPSSLVSARGWRYVGGVFVHRSNRLPRLVDGLAQLLEERRLGPLEREQILIQSAGMQRYLSQELTSRLGVTFGLEFPYPRAFVQKIVDRVLGEAPEQAHYERETLAFHLYRLLGELDQPQVRNFLRADDSGEERFLLAQKLAHLFDQYIVYRPRLLDAWEQAEHEPEDFQGQLWRRLRSTLGSHHFASRVRSVLRLDDAELARALPRRLFLVGGPGLPPLFLSVLARFAELCEVHIFSFTICKEYFADAHPLEGELPELGAGLHPLLLKMGKVGGDYQALLEAVGYQEGLSDFVEAEGDTLLHHLQGDILESRVRSDDEKLPGALLNDGSIQVIGAHSPVREVEILKDQLLALLEVDPTLGAEDIAVLVPDMAKYAPVIRAVFGAAEQPGGIPFRVSDESERALSAAVDTLLRAVELVLGRMKARSVLDILQSEPVQLKLDISPSEFETLLDWVASANIRWGFDATHRGRYGLEEFGLNTWLFGVQRLLLGFAAGGEAPCFGGSVPLDGVEVGDGVLLGKLLEVLDRLGNAQRTLSRPLSVGAFAQAVRELAAGILGVTEGEAPSLTPIWTALAAIERRAQVAGLEEPLGPLLLSRLLEAELSGLRVTDTFLSGGVTFCELLPLRTIPFRVCAVLGLNQADFPRPDRTLSLDRMAARPIRGDRSLRADDRYLFLELLMATREKLLLSYVGRSIQDNTPRPPSVVVTELISTLEGMVREPKPYPVQHHPLEPYSASYFRPDGGLRTFSANHYRAAMAKQHKRRPTVTLPRHEVSAATRNYSLTELESYFKNPARHYLRQLGVNLDEDESDIEDREPVALSPLERFNVGTRALGSLLRGREFDFEREAATGVLPFGAPGELLRAEVEAEVSALHALLAELTYASAPQALKVAVSLPSGRIEGVIPSVFGDRHVVSAFGAPDVRRQWVVWVRHLALCASGLKMRSFLVGRGGDGPEVRTFGTLPAEVSGLLLGKALDAFRRGLGGPLRFDLAASFELARAWWKAERGDKPSDPERVRQAMRRAMARPGPARDPDRHLLFLLGDDDPLEFGRAGSPLPTDTEFAELTRALVLPLLENVDDSLEITEAGA